MMTNYMTASKSFYRLLQQARNIKQYQTTTLTVYMITNRLFAPLSLALFKIRIVDYVIEYENFR